MSRFALGITYEGGAFHGWQRQSSLPTVQGTLEQVLSKIADHPVHLSVAGRTDTGVHATGQVAAFSSEAKRSLHDWQRGLNGLTPPSIRVDWIVPVPPDFHPRYGATARAYQYIYHDVGYTHPAMAGRVWGCQPLDADAMHRAAQVLLGEHDFSAFRGSGCQSVTPMRRVNRCTVQRQGEFVIMHIEANAFLLHMVRNIAQALFAVGSAAETMDISTLLASRDRTLLGPTAPAEGLYLVKVTYPEINLPASPGVPFILTS